MLLCKMSLLGLIFVVATSIASSGTNAADFDPRPLLETAQDVENRLSARIGVAVVETETGRTWNYRGDERFPLNSTFKAFLCAALLDAGDKGEIDLAQSVTVHDSDLVAYSPVTEKRVGGDPFTLLELCEATATISDNAAANLVLKELGGPDSLTRFMRRIGDKTTRLDRFEPELNSAIPGDERDTTTPLAAASSLQKLLLGDELTAASRKQLTSWLVGNKVGTSTLRAGLPKEWIVADKTGAGDYGSRSNIAVIWPENRAPVVIAVYITQTKASFEDRNRAIADIARALVKSLQH
ncbi:Beta-lactamase precursor [Roseibium album]|nr:Beta-lactamase precursor [Roseibium album]